jgi:hypothetical protein
MINKLWCWLRGHDIIEIYKHDNTRSIITEHRCLRCGFEHKSQYDYWVH